MTETQFDVQQELQLVRPILERYRVSMMGFAPVQEPDPGISPYHVRWMIEEMLFPQQTQFTVRKLHRWLGFVQGMMCGARVISVPAERELTRPILGGK